MEESVALAYATGALARSSDADQKALAVEADSVELVEEVRAVRVDAELCERAEAAAS